MSSSNQPVVTPNLPTVLQQLKTNIFRSLNCVKVGTITKFNATAKTAEVQVVFKRVLADGTIQTYPLLLDCPVFTLQGGGAYMRFPIAAGDTALVLFSDRDLDLWFETGGVGAPLTPRAHDLSDAIVLVGLNSKASDMPAYPTDEAQMVFEGAKLALKGSKITVENETTTLLALIEGFIDVLKALTVQDPVSGPIPLTAASIAQLELQKAEFQGLLNS